MNSGHTSERVHDAIKRRLATNVYRPGDRLDPAVLAQELASSVTPIRDALHLLAGRGLVATAIGEGFHVPHVDEPGLQDLYRWNLEVLLLAMRRWPIDPAKPSTAALAGVGDREGAVLELWSAIGRCSTNAEHATAIDWNVDRLQPLQRAESLTIEHYDKHVGALVTAMLQAPRDDLRRRVTAYHRICQRRAAYIVRAFYRPHAQSETN